MKNISKVMMSSGLVLIIGLAQVAILPIAGAATGDILAQFVPGGATGNGRGMAFDGTDLYYTITGDTNIYKVDTSGTLQATIPIAGGVRQGGPLAWDGSALWTMDYAPNSFTLYRVNPADGSIISSCNIATQNPAHPAVTSSPRNIGEYPDGLDWTGSTLWVSSEAFAGNWVVEVDTSCNILTAFNPVVKNGYGTSGVMFDGVDLWHGYPLSSLAVQTDVSGAETGLSFPGVEFEDLAYDTVTFAPTCALWGNEATFGNNRLTAFEIPCGECFTVTKDFRFTSVNFVPIDQVTGEQLPAELGELLPDADVDDKFEVKYVLKPKDGTVSSTNPGQLYGVKTIEGAGVDTVHMDDTFGTQFDVNPAHRGGGVEILRIDAGGYATVLTDDLVQVPTVVVDNTAGTVIVDIDLETPLGADEKLMIYIKYKTALKAQQPDFNDFVNENEVTINGGTPIPASATIEFA